MRKLVAYSLAYIYERSNVLQFTAASNDFSSLLARHAIDEYGLQALAGACDILE